MSARRTVLWGLLIVALVAVAAGGVWEILSRPEPPPILGQVPDFALTNRDGRSVKLSDLSGSPWIADFVFTRCAASCPMMSMRLARLNRELPADLPVKLVSFSVDPDYDTPAVLERYAQSFSAPARWLFLTGRREEMFRLSKEGFKLAVDAGGGTVEEPILHSTRFVLVDGQGRIRGYYEAFDEPSMKKLRRDLSALARPGRRHSFRTTSSPIVGTTPFMRHRSDPDAVWQLYKEDCEGKPLGGASARLGDVVTRKDSRHLPDPLDSRLDFLTELAPQTATQPLVVGHRFSQLRLCGGVEDGRLQG